MKRQTFMEVFSLAEKKFKNDETRLAGDPWPKNWQTLIATMLSAQNRDEVTIPVAEGLFKEFPELEALAYADEKDVFKALKSINYNKTKTKHVMRTAKILVEEHDGRVPDSIEELVRLPGVGRKTANLVVTEVFNKPGICVDTHVHRICNVFGIVDTKTPEQTEMELRRIVPRKYWGRINRYFVLWGKQVPGRDKERLLDFLRS